MPFVTVKNFLCVCSSHPGWMPKGRVFRISVSNGASWTNHSSRSHRLQEHSLRVSRASTPYREMQASKDTREKKCMKNSMSALLNFFIMALKKAPVFMREEASADTLLSEYTDCVLAVGSSWAKDGWRPTSQRELHTSWRQVSTSMMWVYMEISICFLA